MPHYYEINAWFPKNITFASRNAVEALAPAARDALVKAVQQAEERGWQQSEQVADGATQELRRRGMKVDRPSAPLLAEIKRLGERFSIEWVRAVGPSANQLLIPYYTQQ